MAKNLSSVNKFARSLCKDKYIYKSYKPGDTVFSGHPSLDYEVYVLEDGAPIYKWLNYWNKIAITLGEVVIVRKGWLSSRLLRHEEVHVKQWRDKGYKFAWRYCLNPSKYEDSANEAEKETPIDV